MLVASFQIGQRTMRPAVLDTHLKGPATAAPRAADDRNMIYGGRACAAALHW